MGMKEKMMDKMIDKMDSDEKQEMMDSMMGKFFDGGREIYYDAVHDGKNDGRWSYGRNDGYDDGTKGIRESCFSNGHVPENDERN
ncbi:MAG: hypothetical protein JEY91_07645 [Spirochaetaceae bacterium]|nr:hypothetical protein [Spirochaetaceae bacterium]